jgi:hypothetical protein
MAPTAPGPGAAPLPPLPQLSAGGGQANTQSPMAGMVAGLTPIKAAVDQIVAACQMIVKAGTIPGAEQPCSQIVALAASLLPMAAQQMMQPGQGAGPAPGPPPPGPMGM